MRNIILFLYIFSFLAVSAQQATKADFYKAYINGDMKAWARNIDVLERTQPRTVDAKLELVSYYYAHIGYLLGTKKYDEAQKLYDKGRKYYCRSNKVATAQRHCIGLQWLFYWFSYWHKQI